MIRTELLRRGTKARCSLESIHGSVGDCTQQTLRLVDMRRPRASPRPGTRAESNHRWDKSQHGQSVQKYQNLQLCIGFSHTLPHRVFYLIDRSNLFSNSNTVQKTLNRVIN